MSMELLTFETFSEGNQAKITVFFLNFVITSLQDTCYHQAEASEANPSWYQLDDRKVTSL